MSDSELNPLIRDRISQVIDDRQTKEFVLDILEIERSYERIRSKGKMDEYESALAKYVRRD